MCIHDNQIFEPEDRIMRIKEIMSSKPQFISPDTTLKEAASIMQKHNFGFVPVGDKGTDRLIGTLTDRDITVNAVAKGLDPTKTKVSDIMRSNKVLYCFEDDDILKAAQSMQNQHVRRLVVLNKDKRFVGIVSLADFATKGQNDKLCGEIARGLAGWQKAA